MTVKTLTTTVQSKFKNLFGGEPQWIVRAPGRVNLIGEHTDYNDGFVLPMAIDRSVWIALRQRHDSKVYVSSIDFNHQESFTLDRLQKEQSNWVEYIKGVAWALMKKGYRLLGWEGVIAGNVPIGAGLSSSAAIELASALAFSLTSNIKWDARQMALIAQQAENNWIGVSSGIMDQMISASGQAGHALLIDCRSLETQPAPLPEEAVVVILDTGTRRELVDSAYNERRSQCEEAAKYFGVKALRDVTIGQFETNKGQLDPLIARRARHIITENERTIEAARAMKDNDSVKMGQLMIESHISLRDDFEVSSAALDLMVDLALKHKACFGARMTGGGFGGCAVALIAEAAVQDFIDTLYDTYYLQTNIEPKLYICAAANGAEVITQQERS